MGVLIRFSKGVDAFTEKLGWISQMLVIITVAIGFYNVAARYIGRFIGLQLSSNLFIELQWYLYSLVFLLGFAYGMKHGVNVRVDFIYAKMAKKTKAMIDFWGHLFFLIPFTIIGIYVSIKPILYSWGWTPNGWGTWELSPDPSGLPRAPIKTFIIVAFITLFLQTIAELVKLYLAMKDREDEYGTAVIIEEEAPLRIE